MPLPPNCPVSLEYVPAGERSEGNHFVVAWDDTYGSESRMSFHSYGAATECFIRQVRRWKEAQGDINREDLAKPAGGQYDAPSE
jgi:hypothetical protein